MFTNDGAPSVTEDEWQVVADREHERHFAEGDPDAVADAYTFLRDARRTRGDASGSIPIRSDPGTSMGWHDDALSDLFAALAIQWDSSHGFGIAAFRRKALNGSVLPRQQAGPWVVERAHRDGKATILTEASPAGNSSRIETLAYGIEGDEWTHRVPVRVGGVLDDLRRVSERLVKFFGWMPAQASFFVLTDAVPWVSSFRSTVQTKAPLRARERITLDVHPTCTPQEVAKFYSRLRSKKYGRLRRLSAKHSTLAAFYAAQPSGTRPAAALTAWNALCSADQHPKHWLYSDRDGDQFHRDAKAALARLANLSSKPLSWAPELAGVKRIKVPKKR